MMMMIARCNERAQMSSMSTHNLPGHALKGHHSAANLSAAGNYHMGKARLWKENTTRHHAFGRLI
eukprot:3755657-Karenia_brevis.AAC.1